MSKKTVAKCSGAAGGCQTCSNVAKALEAKEQAIKAEREEALRLYKASLRRTILGVPGQTKFVPAELMDSLGSDMPDEWWIQRGYVVKWLPQKK